MKRGGQSCSIQRKGRRGDRGNGGIGLGMVLGLASAGATIVIAALKKSQAAIADLALMRFGLGDPRRCHPRSSVSALFSATLERCGRLDILVNNAGINIRHPAHELSLAEWHTVIDTNLTSAFMCAKAAYPIFKRGGGGKIINIGSMMSNFGASFAPAYAASKAASFN